MPPQIHEITKEIGANSIEHFSAEHTQSVEHSQYARSKKVIQGPLFVPKHATDDRTANPVQVSLTGVSASISPLKKNTAYRFVTSRAAFFRLSAGSSTAVASDIYIPANMPTVIHTGTLYDTLSVIKAEAADAVGIAQVVEVK
jgi:uncharacterized protein (DUF2252 family)